MCSAHLSQKMQFFSLQQPWAGFLCNGDSILCDVYSKVFYKILNFRRLPISAGLLSRVPRDR
jgi:hypothetical protein